jgi:hypothetical protein
MRPHLEALQKDGYLQFSTAGANAGGGAAAVQLTIEVLDPYVPQARLVMQGIS